MITHLHIFCSVDSARWWSASTERQDIPIRFQQAPARQRLCLRKNPHSKNTKVCCKVEFVTVPRQAMYDLDCCQIGWPLALQQQAMARSSRPLGAPDPRVQLQHTMRILPSLRALLQEDLHRLLDARDRIMAYSEQRLAEASTRGWHRSHTLSSEHRGVR